MRSLLLIMTFTCVSCVSVAPWEREYLADPAMTFGSEEAEDAPVQHARDYREGGANAGATRAGGCGCN